MFVERDAKWPLENSLLGHQIAAQFFNPFPLALWHPSSSSPPCLACILLISPPVILALVSPYSIPLPPNSASPFFSLFDSQNHRWVVYFCDPVGPHLFGQKGIWVIAQLEGRNWDLNTPHSSQQHEMQRRRWSRGEEKQNKMGSESKKKKRKGYRESKGQCEFFLFFCISPSTLLVSLQPRNMCMSVLKLLTTQKLQSHQTLSV